MILKVPVLFLHFPAASGMLRTRAGRRTQRLMPRDSTAFADRQVSMDRYTAGRLEGMLRMSRQQIEAFGHELHQVLPRDRRQELMFKLGNAMTELLDISWAIYEEHPALNPHPKAERDMEKHRRRVKATKPKRRAKTR
jgi:hypothetical protein